MTWVKYIKSVCSPIICGYLLIAAISGCETTKSGNDNGQDQLPPPLVELKKISPQPILPATTLSLAGTNFIEGAEYTLEISGNIQTADAAHPVEVKMPVSIKNTNLATAQMDTALFEQFGEGKFNGQAAIIARNAAGELRSEALSITLEFAKHLTPELHKHTYGMVFLGSIIEIQADGLLLGAEGETIAEIKGCFMPEGRQGTCKANGDPIAARVQVFSTDGLSRERGGFEFAPSIVGITPGVFLGNITLTNEHRDAEKVASSTRITNYQLQRSKFVEFGQTQISLGQYLDVKGAGFVSGEQTSTIIHFDGAFKSASGASRELSFALLGERVNSELIRAVAVEGDGIGAEIELRKETGVLDGNWTISVSYQDKKIQGATVKATLNVAPVKQVVWVRFTQNWQDSLRLFGLYAADDLIKKRILEVMRRDYQGINVEFRDTQPVDYKLYAKLDFSGEDPNGADLLGFDNTHGKDVENIRLQDWVGGVNALTQEDGYSGYGGIFLKSLFGFSEHPIAKVKSAPLKTVLFDQVFDPFRPDRGQSLSSSEALTMPVLTDTSTCPATERLNQAACAVLILGNLVGSTGSHEFGHSLGLAYPYGSDTTFHLYGDLPNRLMESGGNRPFTERAELNGQGPAMFCDTEYQYLTAILPLPAPLASTASRPSCSGD